MATAIVSYLGAHAIDIIALRIKSVYPRFQVRRFGENAIASVDEKSLFKRADAIAIALVSVLPKRYESALSILVECVGPPRKAGGYGPLENFWMLPLTRFVSRQGICFFDESMAALRELTRRFTSEFDVRPFIERYQSRAVELLTEWTVHSDHHVRRLASEGVRPRLPWATHLHCFRLNPTVPLTIIERLKSDESIYVRKSVANNLADVLKDNKVVGLETAERWFETADLRTLDILNRALKYSANSGCVRSTEIRNEIAIIRKNRRSATL